jgi:hypothetical protein
MSGQKDKTGVPAGIDVAYDHDVIVSVDSGGNLVVWDSNLETTIDQVVVNDLDLPVGMCAVSTTSEVRRAAPCPHESSVCTGHCSWNTGRTD